MKSPFPKMAFWKTNEPPKSELAARSRDSISPPSRSAEIIDGTTKSGSAFAQNDAGMGTPSAYNRTRPYSYERPDSDPLDAVRPASTYTASNTLNDNGKVSSNGFGQSPGVPDYGYQNRSGNLGMTDNGQSGNNFAIAPVAAELPARYQTRSDNEPTQADNQTPSYPSTSFAAFSPKASNASLESNLDASEQNAISQVSSNSPLNTSPTTKPSMPPSLPVSALNRQGSYAPGSTGSSARPVNANGFNPYYSTPAATQSGCPSGCSCDKCKTPSAGGDFLPRGGFYGN